MIWKVLAALLIAATLVYVTFGTMDFVWTLYSEGGNASVANHIEWTDAAWALVPSLAVVVSLALGLRLAIKDFRRWP